MKKLDAHRKLMSLMCLVLVGTVALVGLAGCSDGLLPQQQGRSASALATYDQVVESFDRIVPGMTQAQDLPNLGFDASAGNVDVLSHVNIEKRFLAAPGLRWEQLDPTVRACINAQVYCSGYVFHPRRAADVTLLVMNGRVVHKVFSGNPRV
jgi:hypothetical protein